jgi:hypothetical protein
VSGVVQCYQGVEEKRQLINQSKENLKFSFIVSLKIIKMMRLKLKANFALKIAEFM